MQKEKEASHARSIGTRLQHFRVSGEEGGEKKGGSQVGVPNNSVPTKSPFPNPAPKVRKSSRNSKHYFVLFLLILLLFGFVFYFFIFYLFFIYLFFVSGFVSNWACITISIIYHSVLKKANPALSK
jgi:hypothetical protein